MLITLFVVFIFLSFAGAVIGGRVAGRALTAVCGIALAYIMPPAFSLRVSETGDMVALAFFGAAGLVLTENAPSSKRRSVFLSNLTRDPDPNPPARHPQIKTSLSSAVEELVSSELGNRLRDAGVTVITEGGALPCPGDDTRRILSDAVSAALETPGVRGISIYGGQCPAVHLLKVVAHCTAPGPEATIVIGERESNCTAGDFRGWPPGARANWFDNGYERTWQISIAPNGSSIPDSSTVPDPG